MSRVHLVRVGALAWVGRFTAVDAVVYPRGSRVIVRTARGLEIGEVLGPADDAAAGGDGSLLRGMAPEDHLLAARLEMNRLSAIDACADRLGALGATVALIDAEHLFDGHTLVFYFLGDTTPAVEAALDELAEVYDARAQFRQFAETVTTGCGPDCGTEHAAGHGCTTCATGCAVSAACASKRGP